MALSDWIAGSTVRTNIAFGIACFCCFLGFLVAIAMYVYYGFVLQKEMAGGNQALTYVFVGQGFGGMVAALFNRPASGGTG
ncbi:MAG: hypothetical protein M1438_09585 [Deltaproteobacteria bacterium]|nr:hypothetical protein [Deltaproteobacteria bacterium]